jgi:hypothetical protein
MNTDLNLVTAWNTLWQQLTSWAPGLGSFLAVVGLGIVVVFLFKWAWSKRRGGGAGGFPWMAVIIGLVLAGPTVVVPLVLAVIQVIFAIAVNIIKWATNTLPG